MVLWHLHRVMMIIRTRMVDMIMGLILIKQISNTQIPIKTMGMNRHMNKRWMTSDITVIRIKRGPTPVSVNLQHHNLIISRTTLHITLTTPAIVNHLMKHLHQSNLSQYNPNKNQWSNLLQNLSKILKRQRILPTNGFQISPQVSPLWQHRQRTVMLGRK